MYSGSLVRLRAVEPSDAETLHRFANDPAVAPLVGVRYPVSLVAEREWAERAGVVSYGSCHFAVETLEGGELLGTCWLSETALPENRCAELGISLGALPGRGYGTDAVRTLCRFGFEQMNLHRIELQVFAHNAAARRVYEKAGFVEEACSRAAHWGDGAWWDDVLMSLLAGELR